MTVLVRAVVYATLFIGLVLVYLPNQLLSAAGVTRPERIGPAQAAGLIVGAVGGLVALWCILTFALIGRGTPAPFDPPRRLVVKGPYRYLRNPMYLGAALALMGAALFYESRALWVYAGGFLAVMHLFVVLSEEPILRRTFGTAYIDYCRRVNRWWPANPPPGVTVGETADSSGLTFDVRRANLADVDDIAAAHLDSIRSIGARYYDAAILTAWGGSVEGILYAKAMADGEVFYIATGTAPRAAKILGFASHRIDEGEHRTAVYVRGAAARRGVGSALFRRAEADAIAAGAATINVAASLAAVEFYAANGFESIGQGEHRLASGRSMPCVFMRKDLRRNE